jgi:hypothetical protein
MMGGWLGWGGGGWIAGGVGGDGRVTDILVLAGDFLFLILAYSVDAKE